LELRGVRPHDAEVRGKSLLDRVGLLNRADAFTDKLSGGEQQRIAIARALVHEPDIVLADEPTGNLDEETGKRVLRLLLELTKDAGKTLIMATHNPEILPLADRVCRIHEGKLVVTSQQQGEGALL
jgi:putative ABC transport system ATP-binding protein